MTKGFWLNPITLLTILGLTFGNVYECKVLIEVYELSSGVTRSYETTAEYFGFTGLVAIFIGPFLDPLVESHKMNQVSSTVYLYLKEKENLPAGQSSKSD